MSIMVPEEVGNLFMVLTGEQWPQIDEDRLRQLSEAWQTASARLSGELGPELARALENIRSQATGKGAQLFADRMEPFVSSPGHIYTAASSFGELSKFLKETSLQVEYVKLVTILSLIALLAEMAWAIAMAVPTFGASMTQLAASFAITRFLISRWWGRLLMRIVQAQIVGIGLQLAIDSAAQGIQFAKGSRDEWDKKATQTAAGVGALGGALALPFSALGGMFGNILGRGMVKGLGDKVDQKILKDAAEQAAKKHAKDYPHVSMAKFADMVSNSMSSAAGNALGRNAKYAGMSLKGMWADKFGKGLAETIEEGLHEFFTEGLYGAMTGKGFDANPFAFTAGMASGGANNLGNLIGDASFASVKPPEGGGRSSSGTDSDSGGLLENAADIDGAGAGPDPGSQSSSSDHSGGSTADGPREAGSPDEPGRQRESSTTDGPGAIDRSVTSSTTSVPDSPDSAPSDGPPKSPQESPATVGAGSSSDGRSGDVPNDQRATPVPGGQPASPDSSSVNDINGSPNDRQLPAAEPGGAPGQNTPGGTTSPDAPPVGGTSPADGAPVQEPGGSTQDHGPVGDSTTSENPTAVPESAQSEPPSGTDPDAQAATSTDTSQPPSTTDPSSQEQSTGTSPTAPNQAAPPESATSPESAAPSAAKPVPLPASVTDGAAVVTIPTSETTVDGLRPGIAPDSRSVVAVSETNSGNDVVLRPAIASQLATGLGKDVTALTPGRGRRGPQWKTFPADGSRPKPANTGGPITAPPAAPAEQSAVSDVPTASSSSVPTATSPAAKTPESRTVSIDASGKTVEPEPASEDRDAAKDPDNAPDRDTPTDLADPGDRDTAAPQDVANPISTPPAAEPGDRDPGAPDSRTTQQRGAQPLITQTPGGRGHVVGGGEYPVLHQIAADLPKDDSAQTIVAMGSKNGIATDSGRVADAELAELISSVREPGDKRPIRLFACDLGAGGKDSQGARLAQASNAPVLAARGWVWQSGSPHPGDLDCVVSSAQTLPDGTVRPKLPPDGSWVLYTPNPDGTVESRDLGPHLPGNLGDEIGQDNLDTLQGTSGDVVADKTSQNFADQPAEKHWTHLADPAVADPNSGSSHRPLETIPGADQRDTGSDPQATAASTQPADPAGPRADVRTTPVYELDMNRVAKTRHHKLAEELGSFLAELLSERAPAVLRERVAELLRDRAGRVSGPSASRAEVLGDYWANWLDANAAEILRDRAAELLDANVVELLRDRAARRHFLADVLGDREIEMLPERAAERLENDVAVVLRGFAKECEALRDRVAQLNDPCVRFYESESGFGRVEIDYSYTQLKEIHRPLAYELMENYVRLFSNGMESEFDRMREAFATEPYRSYSASRDDEVARAADRSANHHDFDKYDEKFTDEDIDRMGSVSQLGKRAAIDLLLHGNEGFLISEVHGEHQGWQFLRENLHALKHNGVDTVYLEHFRHGDYQVYVDQYLNGSSGVMSPQLGGFTKLHDGQWKLPSPNGLRWFLATANLVGVRVVGVDTLAARLGGSAVADRENRANRMNYFAAEIIRNDQHRTGKYVVLLGVQHAHTHSRVATPGNNISQGIPGLAQLLGAPVVRIDPQTIGPELHLEDKQNRQPKSDDVDTTPQEPEIGDVQQDRRSDIERAAAARDRTPAGSSYYDDAGLREAARKVLNDGRHYTVDVHALPDGRVQIGKHALTVHEFADVLRDDKDWNGTKPIRLLASGAGSNALARELSRELSKNKMRDEPYVSVTAPQGLVWIDTGGHVFSSGQTAAGRPEWPPNRRWITYHGGKSMTYASKGFHP